MGVDAFGGLDRHVTQPLGDVVQCIPTLAIEHPVGDAVSERVRRHLRGGATRPSTVNGRTSAASTAARTTFRTDSVVIRSA